MGRELAEAIIEAIECSGAEAKLRENYSGRGMYGETTCGVVTDESLVFVIGSVISAPELFAEDEGFAKFDVGVLRSDSMGLGIIIY